MKNIVACIDFSETTSAVVKMASSLATAFGTKLYLLNIPVFEINGIAYDTWVVATDFTQCVRKSSVALDQLRDSLAEHGIDATAVLLQDSGTGVNTILDEAQRLDAGLIIAGSHGHGAVYRMLLGSTSEGLARRAKCPVLIIPSKRPIEHEASCRDAQAAD